jgi:hypothetical protein
MTQVISDTAQAGPDGADSSNFKGTGRRHESALAATMASKKFLLNVQLKSKSRWSVRLGPLEWVKHTYERPTDDYLQLLGSARHGMQVGALAKLGDEFVLVVGDHVSTLSRADNKDLAAATAHAQSFEQPMEFQKMPPVSVAAPVVVVIKRRRIPAPH